MSIPKETVIPPETQELPEKEFRKVLDTYLETGKTHVEDYEAMSSYQQNIIQIIKKSVERIKYKLKKYGKRKTLPRMEI